MTDQTTIEAASKRLSLALDTLDAAVERRLESDRSEAMLANQVHALGGDRAKLAAELDVTTGRTRALEAANREIAHRVDSAINSIRSVLDTQDR